MRAFAWNIGLNLCDKESASVKLVHVVTRGFAERGVKLRRAKAGVACTCECDANWGRFWGWKTYGRPMTSIADVNHADRGG